MSIETSFRFFVHVGYALPTERPRAEKFCKAFLEIDKCIVSATATQCPSVVHLYLQAAEAEKNKEGKAPKQSDGKGVLLAAAAAAAAPTASATQIPSDANTDKNTWHLFCYPSAEERISKILQDWDAIFKTPVFPLASLSKFSMRPSSSILNLWWNKETGQVARGELQTYNMTASQVYEMVTEQESPGDSTFEKGSVAANADWLMCGLRGDAWKNIQSNQEDMTKRIDLLLNHGPYPKWNGLWIWVYFVFAHL